jgi:hypothetical protein
MIAIGYGSGIVYGTVGIDDVNFGGYEVQNVSFGMMDGLTRTFLQIPFDGILGMGFENISVDKLPTVFELLLDQGLINDPVYSFFLTRDPNATGSELVLGGIDPKYNTTEFKFYDLLKLGYYTTALADFGVGNTSYGRSSMQAIVDTGTSLIVGPLDIIKKVKALFPEHLDCNNVTQYPTLYFTFGNDRFEVTPDFYILNDEGQCILGLQELPLDFKGSFILGEVFLRKYYTAFDYGNKRIGFALANQS